jgi:hypothetical protein
MLQGVGFAACLPVVGAVTSAWARIAGKFKLFTGFINLSKNYSFIQTKLLNIY